MDTLDNYSKLPTSKYHPADHPKMKWGIFLGLISILVVLIFITSNLKSPSSPIKNSPEPLLPDTQSFIPFTSSQDFHSYINQANTPDLLTNNVLEAMDSKSTPPGANFSMPQSSPTTTRYSTTNVQVSGIDEPDIVKTNGQQIFYGHQNQFWPIMPLPQPIDLPVFRDDIQFETDPEIISSPSRLLPPQVQPQSQVNIFQALPPQDLQSIAQIPHHGQLLLHDSTLLVLGSQSIHSYDVSDPQTPVSLWDYSLVSGTQLSTARMYQGTLYLVLQKYHSGTTCPMEIIQGVPIACDRIYHPLEPIYTDNTTTLMQIDPTTGEQLHTTAFVSSSDSTIYMSPQAIYATYTTSANTLKIMIDFLGTDYGQIVPDQLRQKILNLNSYDLSEQAKLTELDAIFQNLSRTFGPDQALELEAEIANAMSDYSQAHGRNFTKTSIIKFSNSDFQIIATGQVPGHLLNQFSLDEYQGNLRLATTIENNSNWAWRWSSKINFNQTSANDIYILDSKLSQTGQITNLGLTEQIYAVRFLNDQGYLVTFRQIDPFYVLDLSNPSSPKMTGELKIPGYSSYLHPLTANRILGIGQDSNQVKLTIFDVANPNSPTEQDTYQIPEFWSEVSSSHHAFLHDPDHQIFFIPAGGNGYIFSYPTDNSIELVKSLKLQNARRALFINDYLYIVTDQEIVVLDQTTWQEVSRLNLQ